jgi:hypothetical protein
LQKLLLLIFHPLGNEHIAEGSFERRRADERVRIATLTVKPDMQNVALRHDERLLILKLPVDDIVAA